MSGQPAKYAIQRPKGTKWETLALIDDPGQAHLEYQAAIARHGVTFVRLIEVRFKSSDVLADYDWRLIELHDPLKRNDRPNLKVVSSTAGRGGKRWSPGSEPIGRGRQRRPGERVPMPVPTYVLAFLFGALAVLIWGIWFRN